MSPHLTAITDFAAQLESASLHYSTSISRHDAVMFAITIPGERWEVEFLTDGSVDVEVFRSDGNIYGPKHLESLFVCPDGQ